MQTPDSTMQLAQALLTDKKKHELFLAHLDELKKRAATVTDVVATPYQQAGREVLVATCPLCGTVAGLSGEGRHSCRGCHTFLRYIRAK